MTEAELERGIVELARLLGYRVAHFGIGLLRKGWRTPARADAAGFPDLVTCGNGRVLYRELKCGRNRLTVEQAEWLDALTDAGCDVGVWRDLDWHSGTIEAELAPGLLEARREDSPSVAKVAEVPRGHPFRS